jgi:hypothetical protein
MRTPRRFLVLCCAALAGCATATITGFRAPGEETTSVQSIAAFTLGLPAASRKVFEGKICEQLAPVRCVPGVAIIPPIREYGRSEMMELLDRSGVEGILLVSMGADEAWEQYLYSTTSTESTTDGTATATARRNGSTTRVDASGRSKTSTTSTSTDVSRSNRRADGDIRLYDRASGRVIWGGDLGISASGYIGTGNSTFFSAAGYKIASTLKTEGLVQPPSP